MTTGNHTGIAYTTNLSANATESTPNTATTSEYVYDPCPHFWAQYCFSFGLNRFTFEFALVALLTMFQLSMVILIVARCRHDTSFRQAFYAQFVAVTIVDCYRMTLQLVDWLQQALQLYLMPGFFRSYLQATLAIGNIPQYAQSMLHLLIAVNRFTAFFAPLSHDSLWSHRAVGGSLAASLVLSILFHVVPYYGPPWLSGDPGGAQWDYMIGAQVQVDNLVNAAVCFVTAVGGFSLSIATIVKMRSLARSGQMREANNRRDAVLLLYSLFMVLVQLLVTAATAIAGASAFIEREVWSVTSEERETYKNQTWYKMFTAVSDALLISLPPTRLSEIYSLSGSLFLLLISKQVRSAYLEFYFKRTPRTKNVVLTPVTSIFQRP